MKKQNQAWILILLVGMLSAMLMIACGSDDEETADTDGDEDGDTSDDDDDDDDTDGDEEDDDGVIGPKMEKMGLYNVVWLHGTPYEMGYQHGELLHDIIGEAVEFVLADPIMRYIPDIAESAGILEMADTQSYQAIKDECQGLVDATADVGMTMDLCMILNFGDVMLEHIPFKKSGDRGPGCTEVLANGDATPDGHLLHARNLDWGSMDISIIHEYPVIFVRQPKDGIANLYVGFPLNLTPYTGMNAAGLSACSNEADPAEGETKTEGRSHAQMLSVLLANYSSLDEARDFIMNEPHMSAETLVVADGNAQDGIIFELTANHQVARELADNGAIYAVNHFLDASMGDYDLPQDMENPDSSIMRQERLQQLVDQDGEDSLFGQLDLNGLATVMRDRVNPRTGEEAPWDEENIDNDAGIATNGPMHFVIFDPAKLLVWVAAGQLPIPAQPYQCFSLGELLNLPDAVSCDPETIPATNVPNAVR